jgi:vacuolar protein sorting-associated protein 35
MATPAPPEDQARLLEDALVAVRQQTSVMRKCLETPGKLMDALKCWYVLLSYRAICGPAHILTIAQLDLSL